jgi:hypothetical protein
MVEEVLCVVGSREEEVKVDDGMKMRRHNDKASSIEEGLIKSTRFEA